MPDIAQLGLSIDTRQVVEGSKALDSLGDAAVRAEQKAGSLNGQMNDTSKIMRAQAEQARANAQATTALGGSTTQLTLGQQQLIERMREQAATIGMSRTQLLAYQAAQMGVTKETQQAIATIKAHEDALKAAAKAKDDAAAASGRLTGALGLLAAGFALLKVGDYIKESALLSARYETLGVVMEVVGRNAGYTKTQMMTATDAIARQGITMVESRESAVKLVQAHVDLKNATVLARIAQDAAVIGHLNSSDAFDRLVNGISRGNVLILRNIGINVNLQSAYRQMADELGKTTKELTENERVQARLNAVIERGADIAGTYEAAMGTAGKQLTSMQRYVQDLKTNIGETFNEVLTVSVMAFTSQLKDANGEVSELSRNGQLAEWGHALAQVFVVVADNVNNVFSAMKLLAAGASYLGTSIDITKRYAKDIASAGFSVDGQVAAYEKQRAAVEANKQALAKEKDDILAGEDKFQKAFDERTATVSAKRKSDAEAKLKIDADYAQKSLAIQKAYAGYSLEIQQKAQLALANSIYVGTPDYRDTKGREPKPKVDQAENIHLSAQLKQFEREAADTKAHYDALGKLDDLYLKAGELSAGQAYENKRAYAAASYEAEVDAYQQELAALKNHKSATKAEEERHQKEIEAIQGKLDGVEKAFFADRKYRDEEERLRKDALAAASTDAMNKYIESINQEAQKIEEANRGREASRGAIEREAVAQLDLAIAYQKQFMAGQAAAGATDTELAQAPAILKYLEDQRTARTRLAQGRDAQSDAKHMENLANQAIKDWDRAGKSIADSLSAAFGSGGKAIGQMFKVYSEGVAGQLRAQKELREAKKLSDDNPDKIDAINQAHLSGTTAQLKSYADMTTAAQGFFSEGSKGYQAMAAASQVMHAAEVALTVVKGVNAVLTQGEGDPYSAFARMAAMAAVVAALGVAIGGVSGGSDTTANNRQAATGTGTVLGDSSAKSESIAHSLAIMEKNSGLGLAHTISMDSSLKQMVAGIGNLAGLLARSGVTAAGSGAAAGVQTGTATLGGSLGTAAGTLAGGVGGAALGTYLGMGMAAIGGPLGLAVGAVLGSVLGGVVSKLFNTSTSIKDQGITGKAMSLGNVDALGFTAQAYADVNTKKKAFGISYSSKDSTKTAALSDEMNDQFTMIISSMGQTIRSAADVLGLGGEAFNTKLNTFVVDLGKISLKDLTGEEQQKALETAFSKLGDDMAKFGVAGLQQYQAVGEGYLETLVRVTNDYMQVSDVLAVLGKSFNTTGLGAVALSESLIAASGGLDKLTSGTGFFVENFLTEAERMAPITKSVNDAMGKLGQSGVTTVEQFKALVLAQDMNTAAGQAMYAQLIAIAEPFKKAADYAAELAAATGDFAAVAKTASEIASERRDLQQQLNELTKSEMELLAIQRAGIADVNRALFDQVQAAKAVVSAKDALAKAYDTEAAAAKTALDKSKSWVTTLNGLNASMALGAQSTLTPEQKYAEARAQFEKTLAAANAGDTTAQSGLSAAEQAFLAASQVVNASDAKYVADYARVMAANDEALKWAGMQVDVQQASLDALTAQVSGLITINDSVLTVAQAIANLQAAMGVSSSLGVEFTNAPAVASSAALSSTPAPVVFDVARYSAGSNAGSYALVAEIRGLREDNKKLNEKIDKLNADANKNANAQIASNFEANKQAAKTVVAGIDKSTKASAWAKQPEYEK